MSNIAAMSLHPGGGIPSWPNPAATPFVTRRTKSFLSEFSIDSLGYYQD